MATAAIAAAALVAAAALHPDPASAGFPFKRCYRRAPIDCAIVDVPLDRTGRVAGTVPLHVVRLKARHRPPPGQARSAVVGLAGGPGQSGLPLFEDFLLTIQPALRTRDLLVLDQRGTGRSGLLRCRGLEHPPAHDPRRAVQRCAARLGPARAFYTTTDSADDLEAARQAAGVDKLVLYGTSYGTKLALVYAQRYPTHVERLVLDSLVDVDGPDPYYRDTFGAIPRVLRELCAHDACRGITADPVADLGALVRKLEVAPLAGRVVRGDGRSRPRRLGRASILDILLEGDFDPQLRAAFPAAVRSALAGDAAPMLRLARIAEVHDYFPPDPPSLFSAALFTATTCEEGPLPWGPQLSFGDRWTVARRTADGIPDSAFAPFDRATGRASDTLRLCAPWPASGRAPTSSEAPLPDVPTLILGGAADLRTPMENDAALAARLPHASTVLVPRVGHSVLDSDLSGCADEAVAAFFRDKPVRLTCSRLSRQLQDLLVVYPPTPIAPRSLGALATPRHLRGRPGRTVRAAELTFYDAILQLLSSSLSEDQPRRVERIGGLRAGRLIARTRPKIRLRLDRYSYVRGVAVSARLGNLSRSRLRLRVGGRHAARGRLTFDLDRDRVTGRLGGRRVHLRFTADIGAAVGGLYELRGLYRFRNVARASSLRHCCDAAELLGHAR